MAQRQKELTEQLATQETVFRTQLQELGQFIKEQVCEKVREKRRTATRHKLDHMRMEERAAQGCGEGRAR